MGWGTRYKYNGYLSRIHKDSIDDKLEECKQINDLLWREVLAYMASTPPTMTKDIEGTEHPYQEFLAAKVKELRDNMEENYRLIASLEDCVEAMIEDPESVKNE